MDFPELTGLVGFDTETRDPTIKTLGPGWCFNRNDGYIVGVSLAWETGQEYWPLYHEGGGNIENPDGFWAWLKAQAAKPDITWVGHQTMYDRGWLGRHGVGLRGKVHNTQTMGALIDEYRRGRYSLDDMGSDFIQQRKDESELNAYAKSHNLDPKMDLWRIPGNIVRGYGVQDAILPRNLFPVLRQRILDEELTEVYDLEMDLEPLLLAMRRQGVRVDIERAQQVAHDLEKLEQNLLRELQGLVGKPVEVWNAEGISQIFDAKGLSYNMTPKTKKPSFRAHWLEAHTDPVAHQILQIRQLNKTRTTFVEGYVLEHNHQGRIHCQFNPLPSDEGGAVSGRFSSSDPNLQNLPARDKEAGPLVRSLFLPEDGALWCSGDYSQQEPRLMVHFAALIGQNELASKGVMSPVWESALLTADRYRNDPSMDFHNFMVELTGLVRKVAKNIALGRAYGLGGAGFCKQTGFPIRTYVKKVNGVEKTIEVAGPEGQAALDQFDAAVPFVGALSKECQNRAQRRGYITTIKGRRCRFSTPRVSGSDGRAFPYKALNRLIQGSAADQMKAAMLAVWRELGHVPHVTVHDELGISVQDERQAQEIARVMEDCVPMLLPSKVDLSVVENWGEVLVQEAAS